MAKKPTVQLVYDTDPSVRDQGMTYMHCTKCLEEYKRLKLDVTPKQFARQQLAITPTGLQLWCTRHDVNIALITVRIKETK